jgi:hypothetical protein
MTKALRRAFKIASRLPDREQNDLASALLEEVEAHDRWRSTLAESQAALEHLADEAFKEHRAGRTQALDPDTL